MKDSTNDDSCRDFLRHWKPTLLSVKKYKNDNSYSQETPVDNHTVGEALGKKCLSSKATFPSRVFRHSKVYQNPLTRSFYSLCNTVVLLGQHKRSHDEQSKKPLQQAKNVRSKLCPPSHIHWRPQNACHAWLTIGNDASVGISHGIYTTNKDGHVVTAQYNLIGPLPCIQSITEHNLFKGCMTAQLTFKDEHCPCRLIS